jgi:hypothetical protein
MYRLRNLNNILGDHKELEKQTIFLADTDSLNDPLESYIKYYWQGDKIIWDNFFRHYIICLDTTIALYQLAPDKMEDTKNDIPVHLMFSEQTDVYKEIIQRIFLNFKNDVLMQNLINHLLDNYTKKIYKDNLYDILNLIEPYIQWYIIKERNNNIKEEILYNIKNKLDKNLQNILKENCSLEPTLKCTTVLRQTSMYFNEFNLKYIQALRKLTSWNIYIACFSEECSNVALWGYYANNHTGVCLKFKDFIKDNGKLYFKLKNSIDNRFNDYKLDKVIYKPNDREVNFFTNISVLSIGVLTNNWYCDENNNISKYFYQMKGDKGDLDEWRKKYWDNIDNCICHKLSDWKNEREYRISLVDSFHEFKDKNSRAFNYDFNDLEAIIFGMRTPIKERIEIINIIRKKCKENNRESFDFYEMKYDDVNFEFKPHKLYINIK